MYGVSTHIKNVLRVILLQRVLIEKIYCVLPCDFKYFLLIIHIKLLKELRFLKVLKIFVDIKMIKEVNALNELGNKLLLFIWIFPVFS